MSFVCKEYKRLVLTEHVRTLVSLHKTRAEKGAKTAVDLTTEA